MEPQRGRLVILLDFAVSAERHDLASDSAWAPPDRLLVHVHVTAMATATFLILRIIDASRLHDPLANSERGPPSLF
jgi:hypothetical protein